VAAEYIAIEVACAEPDRQTVITLEVPAGCTAGEAIIRSGILARHPMLDPAACGVGIFGREVTRGRVLALPEDPRARRRRLARQGRTMSGGSAARR
jgi:hypothetical protein